MCPRGELVDGFSGLDGVEFGQHFLQERLATELDDIFTSGFAVGPDDFNRSGGSHVGL